MEADTHGRGEELEGRVAFLDLFCRMLKRFFFLPQVLIGNSIIGAMLVAYGGCMRQTERQMAVEKWKNICHR